MAVRGPIGLAFVLGIGAPFGCDQASLVAAGTTARGSVSEVGQNVDGGAPDAAFAEESPGIALEPMFAEAVDPNVLVGGNCVDSQQCDDGVGCTQDTCDEATQRCWHTADPLVCSDGLFCNGQEVCHPRLGCRAGPPESCSDATPCTIDSCDEASGQCVHDVRDADEDGDPDGNCRDGGDCDDRNAAISSQVPEICSNSTDDNCDGVVDELACQAPQYDRCVDAFAFNAPGTVRLNPAGAQRDYATACFLEGDEVGADLAVRVVVPPGPPQRVVLSAESTGARLAIAQLPDCSDSAISQRCSRGVSLDSGLGVSRLRLDSLEPGDHWFAVVTDFSAPMDVSVDWGGDAEYLSPGTCAEPEAIELSRAALVPVALPEVVAVDAGFARQLLASECGEFSQESLYRFVLPEQSDVRVVARSLDTMGPAFVSLRSDLCSSQEAERQCGQADRHPLVVRSLPAGSHLLAVSAQGPSDVELVVEARPPQDPPAGDTCELAPLLPPNSSAVISFTGLSDDIVAGCQEASLDAARSLVLSEPSDVLLVARFSPGDVGSVSLVESACTVEQTLLCAIGSNRAVRTLRHNVPAGQYRVVVESRLGLDATVLAAVRAAGAPVAVPAANGCEDAFTLSPQGGAYVGSTVNADSQASASCDFARSSGAPEQWLRLVLTEPKRVVLDASGSGYNVLLNLRSGPGCPGTELEGGCSLSTGGVVSFIDSVLSAGEYFIQVDGYAGDSGSWRLDAHVLDP